MSDARECRMFPLGSVLMPRAPLPLHIFEARYQQLLNESLEDDRTFGVVLISRGSEVGGGEVRTEIGTLAMIDEHSRFDDGRAAVIARGVSRIQVVEWLPDDPYPRAMVLDLPSESPQPDDDLRLGEAQQALLDLLDVAHRLGRIDEIPTLEWSDDVDDAAWELAAMAPISALDRQRVLEVDGIAGRLGALTEMLQAMAEDLRLMDELE